MASSPAKLKGKVEENGEKSIIAELRAVLEKQHPDFKEFDDQTLGRFLRARDLDVERASSMLMKYLKWRRSFVPNGSVSESEIPNQLAQNKVFMQGTDRKGCPVAVALCGRHFPSDLDEYKRFLMYSLDKICSRITNGEENFTIIQDLQGFGLANNDVAGFIEAFRIFQDYYPERLGKLFYVHVPYIFMAAWKIIYPFVDKSIRKKIVSVGNKKLESTLLEEIDKNQLPEIYGGKMKLVPIQDAICIAHHYLI